MMKTYVIAITALAVTGLSQTVAIAQSSTAAEGVQYVETVSDAAPGCSSCGDHRYTQYVRPRTPYCYTDYVNPYPSGPCCRTVFSELFCDIGYHLNQLIHCQTDVLGATCDDCCGDVCCEDPLDCVPRLRDLVPRPLLFHLLGPSWAYGGWSGYEMEGDYVVSQPMMDDQDDWGEGSELLPDAPTPAGEPDSQPEKTQLPEAPSMPAQSARLRAMLAPPGLARARTRVRRLQYSQPVATSGGQKVNSTAGRSAKSRRQRSKPQALPALTPPKRTASRPARAAGRVRHAVAKTVKVKRPQPVAAPVPAIQFGDQFGKSARSRLSGARFH